MIALHGDVEGRARVPGVALQEELDERVDVLGRDGTRVHCRVVFRVRVADVDGLVEEIHVGVRVPAVLIEGRVLTFVSDAARAELEEQASGRAASWPSIEPQSQRCSLWRPAGLEEPARLSATCPLALHG